MSVEQIRKRLENQQGILLTLHRDGAQQRSALSERLGIRKSSVTSIIADLLARKVIREVTPGATRSPLELERRGVHVLGAVLEAGQLHVAQVGFDGSVVGYARSELRRDGGPQDLLGEVARHLRERIGKGSSQLAGVGVSVPGLVDHVTGTGVYAVNLSGWKGVPVSEFLEKQVGLPVAVTHDGRAQLLGNTWFSPPGEASSNAVHLCLTEGVACGVMVDGRIVTGNHFAVGEIGCLRSGDEGRPCACGKRDCLQTYVSIPALAETLRESNGGGGLGGGSAEEIAAACAAPEVLAALDAALEPLADKLSTVMALIDPEVLLVGTESTKLSEILVPMIQRRLDSDLRGLYAQPVGVRAGSPVTEATLRGIAAIVMEECFARGEFRAIVEVTS